MKFEKIKPGMILYDVHSHRMGNTTVRSMGCWAVRIVSVDPVARTSVVRWNGNPERTWRERDLKKLRIKEPGFETGFLGSKRLKKRAKATAASVGDEKAGG